MASVSSFAVSYPRTGVSSLHRDASPQKLCLPRAAKLLCSRRRSSPAAAASRALRVSASLKEAGRGNVCQSAAEAEAATPALSLSASGLSLGAPLLGLPLLALALLTPPEALAEAAAAVGDGEGVGYSQASYYASLTLFIISIPGLWSLIKRATKSKIVRRTFEVPGPKEVAATGGRTMAQLAGEITSSLQRNNYKVAEAKEVVTFEGDIQPSRSQAFFLVFCTTLSLASVALVLSITNPDVGDWWYTIVGISPLAGVYYWRKAARKEQIQLKIVISDDEKTADIIIQGDDEELERLRRELGLMEKGLEYVKGVFEG